VSQLVHRLVQLAFQPEVRLAHSISLKQEKEEESRRHSCVRELERLSTLCRILMPLLPGFVLPAHNTDMRAISSSTIL